MLPSPLELEGGSLRLEAVYDGHELPWSTLSLRFPSSPILEHSIVLLQPAMWIRLTKNMRSESEVPRDRFIWVAADSTYREADVGQYRVPGVQRSQEVAMEVKRGGLAGAALRHGDFLRSSSFESRLALNYRYWRRFRLVFAR